MVTCYDCHQTQFSLWVKPFVFPVAVSPGDQLLYPEKKKTKAERDAEGDQVDSAHANREHSLSDSVKLQVVLCLVFSPFDVLCHFY